MTWLFALPVALACAALWLYWLERYKQRLTERELRLAALHEREARVAVRPYGHVELTTNGRR